MKATWVKAMSFAAVVALAAAVSLFTINRINENSDASASIEQATNDEEWLTLIEQAKSAGSEFPPYGVGPGVAVITSCEELPEGWSQSQAAVQPSADGSRHRYVFFYADPKGDGRAALVLEPGANMKGCAPGVAEAVNGPDTFTKEVDEHICSEMALMAEGKERTDVTLREASADVAKEYIKAFCE